MIIYARNMPLKRERATCIIHKIEHKNNNFYKVEKFHISCMITKIYA